MSAPRLRPRQLVLLPTVLVFGLTRPTAPRVTVPAAVSVSLN